MKRITLFIFSIFCFMACDNEIAPGIDPQEETQELKLFMPDAEKINVYSTATVSECMIDKIWVLEFNSAGTSLVHTALIDGSDIVGNGQAIQLLPQLPFKLTNGNQIVCIANSDAQTYPHPDSASITLTNINTYFPLMNNGYYDGGEYLPMYGKFTWATSRYTCEMTRAVAKVQVRMGTSVSDVTESFSAENVDYEVFYGARGGYIQPPSGAITGIPQITTGVNAGSYYLLQRNGATEEETNVYFYEYPSSTQTIPGTSISDSVFHRDRQHIILKKTNPNIMGDVTYYRLDFYDSATKKYLDTKRNHHYLFTINKVRSEGYANLSQAQSNPGSNIEYTVLVEDGSQSITSNGQYAIVTNVDTVKLTGDITNQTIATYRYIDPTGVLSVTENSVLVESGSVQPGGATLTITDPITTNPITSTNKELKITTTGNLTQGVILFKLGNITHRLYIKKP